MGRGLFYCRRPSIKEGTEHSHTHLLQQGLQRRMSTRPRQLIEFRGAVKEAADHCNLFTEQPHRVRRRHEAVEENGLDVIHGIVHITGILSAVPRTLLKQTRQAQLGLRACQQLLVPEGIAPYTIDGRPRRVAEPV